MLEQLSRVLPEWLANAPTPLLAWAIAVGVVLWATGARFSRPMITLLGVTAGSWIGVRLPGIFGWDIDPHYIGVFGAIAAGAAAFLLHRTLIGICLGAAVGVWAGAVALARFHGTAPITLPDMHWTGSAVTWLAGIWQTLPGQLAMAIPYASGAGLATGVLIAVLWPRLGRCLLYSMIGSMLMIAGGLPLAMRWRPGWLTGAPAADRQQMGILLGFVLVGVIVQWWGTRGPRRPVSVYAAQHSSAAKNLSPNHRLSQSSSSDAPNSDRRQMLTQLAPAVAR